MARIAVAAVVVIGLALGVWWLWPRDDPTGPSTTVPSAGPTTSATTPAPTTTDSTAPESHVVETVEEAEEILRDLWFGWFEGIYLRDEDRIREVVATEEQVDMAREQFGVMEFKAAPTRDGLVFEDTEILRSDENCLAVWSNPSAHFREGESEGVHVVRRVGDRWILLNYWLHRDDLWEQDCDVQL